MARLTFGQGLSRLTTKFRDAFRAKPAPPRILCADDDPVVVDLCSVMLARAGYQTERASNGREVLEKLNGKDYAAVLLDLSMPFVHGATVLGMLERDRPDLLRRTIVITGAADAVLAEVQGRVAAVLRKPVKLDVLLSAVCDCTGDDTLVL